MFKKIIGLFLLVFVLFSAGLFAMTDDIGSSDDTRRSHRERRLEKWYHMLTFGFVLGIDFKNADGDELDSELFSTKVSVDFLRFYLPIDEKVLVGVGIFGTGFSSGSSAGATDFFAYLYSVGFQYYFDYIGKGFYLRGDVGLSAALWRGEGVPNYGFSYGFLAAFGHALPVSQETSIVFEIGYRYLDIEASSTYAKDLTLGSFYVSAGWLW